MNFTKIINPINGKKYSIFEKKGRQLLKKYIVYFQNNGGSNNLEEVSELLSRPLGNDISDTELEEELASLGETVPSNVQQEGLASLNEEELAALDEEITDLDQQLASLLAENNDDEEVSSVPESASESGSYNPINWFLSFFRK